MLSDASAFLGHLKSLSFYKDQAAHVHSIPPREAVAGELERPLPPALAASLTALGVLPLYSHQAQAINAARQGKNVIVATAAASGKTLCYNVPVLEALIAERGSRALYLFPLKALAQDQLRGLRALTATNLPNVRAATFDGDTPDYERAEIRRSSQIILSNPDMLHLGILPNHAGWSPFLRRLRYVVVDEAHVYRGVFGSHVANVLRRLERLCDYYGSRPQFILSTATIANPKEHAERLTGLPFEVVEEDGSPYGGKDFILWNPPIIDPAKATRRSANSEATTLLAELIQQRIRTLVFVKTRRLAELVYIYARDRLKEASRHLAERVRPYRAGYLPEERREIERDLFEGRLLGVVATNALELGIDIGDLDATVLDGYPGSIASTWQQAGRSGRRGHRSISFLVGQSNPLDQYFMHHPEALFGKSPEHALIDQANRYVIKPQLLATAYEFPLSGRDAKLFGPAFQEACEELEAEGTLRKRLNRWFLAPSVVYPAKDVNIRSTCCEVFSVVDTSRGGALLETVESATAYFQIHPGAIYLHQGEPYLISDLDLKSRVAYAAPTDANYYTQSKDVTDLRILHVAKERQAGSVKVYLGDVEVTTTVFAFKKKMLLTEEVIGEEPLDLPPQSFDTVALWFDIPRAAMDLIAQRQLDLPGGLHACEHACIGMLPLFALCDRNDIGGVSTSAHADTGQAQVFIYDGHPGGIGISEKGYEMVEALWDATLKAVAECPCEDGCPSCIQSPKCGNNNEPLDKAAAQIILREALRGGLGTGDGGRETGKC
ncbi:MAG: DEAD/DEAH box helicase [Chloroflexi bacterium]|nr:DEAD/DEAH box helicase [Chloroflexota bacterium]